MASPIAVYGRLASYLIVRLLWNAVVDKNQNFILYIAIYMYILLYAAIASYLTTAHHCLSLLDHLFNSLYAILTSYHHFTYSVFYSICSYFNITPSFHIFNFQLVTMLFNIHFIMITSHAQFSLFHSAF